MNRSRNNAFTNWNLHFLNPPFSSSSTHISFSFFHFSFFLFLFSFFLFLFSFLFLSGCKSSTPPEDNTVAVSGTVTLEGQADHSGVTVSLYKPVELDPELVAINEQYPNIGVKISQETEFDHREQTAVYSTTTAADGSWRIEGVAEGTYNVMAEKDSFGWRYELNKGISGENTAVALNSLKKAVYIRGNVPGNIDLQEGQFVYVESNSYLPANLSIKLNQNNCLLFGPNAELIIDGNIDTGTEATIISSRDLNSRGRGFVFNMSNRSVTLNSLWIRFLSSPFIFNTKPGLEVTISHSYFRDCNNAVSAKNESLAVQNCIFQKINENALELLTHFNAIRNIFYSKAKVFVNDVDGIIQYNLFLNNGFAILPFKGDSIHVFHNHFSGNKIAIVVNSSNCTIDYNNFETNQLDIELNRNYVQQSYSYCNPTVKKNNFFTSDTAISIYGRNSLYAGGLYAGSGVNSDIIVANCYWGTTDSVMIQQKLYDAFDNPNVSHNIIYYPFEFTPIENSGIK